MKKLLLFALALGAIYVGVTSGWRTRAAPGHQPDLDQWEGEGGAVPSGGQRTAAQTRPDDASAD